MTPVRVFLTALVRSRVAGTNVHDLAVLCEDHAGQKGFDWNADGYTDRQLEGTVRCDACQRPTAWEHLLRMLA